MKKHILMFSILILLINIIFISFSSGEYNNDLIKNYKIYQMVNFDAYNSSEIYDLENYPTLKKINSVNKIISSNFNRIKLLNKSDKIIQFLNDPPIDSLWPMYCHDARHTGRSPYITTNTTGIEKWRFWTELSGIYSGIAISDDGTIYFSGSYDIYAVYPNGTLRWRYDPGGGIESCPAIDENGIIYVGTAYGIDGDHLYALYPDGTLKWKYFTGDNIFSSPVIGSDSTIYFGCDNHKIYALYSNGTLKWEYTTGNYVLSSPAIGDDGTIYCGSHDNYLYALYPNNGTLKWKYKTGHWVRVGPCIADDGTIYVVSLDNYLYALYPNGTLKWKTNMGQAGTTPTIGHDGTIYAGYETLHAINPANGSIKWKFNVDGTITGATPCHSLDETIYLGNTEGSDIIAINPDGTEKWRKTLYGDIESAPAIGKDGTVYIGSQLTNGGYLHAFGYPGPNPLAPDIDGPSSGKPGTPYSYKFTSIDPDGDQVSYYIDWGDGNLTDWTDFQSSGEQYSESHSWTTHGTYIVRAKAKDTNGYESEWGTLTVTMTRDKAIFNSLLLRLLEKFPILQKILIFF